VPKPRDWGEHIDVVGYFFEEEDEEQDEEDEEGGEEGLSKPTSPPSTEGLPPALRDWLYPSTSPSTPIPPSPPPLFVGFGSMIIEDTSRLTSLITTASAAAGVRVILQSSWSKMEGGKEEDGREGGKAEHVFFLGDFPHSLLMPHVSAVVHHGGAGTVAAGLRAGREGGGGGRGGGNCITCLGRC